jgi:hypothetical protein
MADDPVSDCFLSVAPTLEERKPPESYAHDPL